MNNPGDPDTTNHLAINAADSPALAASAVSWSAILAGAAGAAALSLILLLLGAGLGLSLVSPWVGGITATTFGVSTTDDVRYVAQLVARHARLTQPDAEQRVTDTYARLQTALQNADAAARAAADTARKATAYASLWLVVSLLGGALAASFMATCGGRQRDH